MACVRAIPAVAVGLGALVIGCIQRPGHEVGVHGAARWAECDAGLAPPLGICQR